MTTDPLNLSYATPRIEAHTPRPNWLAVFAFAWTFGVTPGVMLLIGGNSGRLGWGLSHWGDEALAALALVGVPLAGAALAHVATERGAGFDSSFRWTLLAVWAAPFANVMLGAGLIVLFRGLRVIPV